MRLELQRIGIWSVTKVSFFFHAIAGFVMGILFALVTGLMLAIEEQLSLGYGGGYSAEAFPIGTMLVIMPIAFAVGGAVFGTIGSIVLAFVYNSIARLTGGIELDLAEAADTRLSDATPRLVTEDNMPSRLDAPPPPLPQPPFPPDSAGPNEPPAGTDGHSPETDRMEP